MSKPVWLRPGEARADGRPRCVLTLLRRCVQAVEAIAARMEGESSRANSRLRVSAASVLPARIAAELLPMNDAEASRWLRESGVVRDLKGRRVVVWGDVVEMIRGAPDSDRVQKRRLRRVSLE